MECEHQTQPETELEAPFEHNCAITTLNWEMGLSAVCIFVKKGLTSVSCPIAQLARGEIKSEEYNKKIAEIGYDIPTYQQTE